MFDVHGKGRQYLGVIEYGMPSYTGDESYDYVAVLSAGGVSSCQIEELDEEQSVLDLYAQVYKATDTSNSFQKRKSKSPTNQ